MLISAQRFLLKLFARLFGWTLFFIVYATLTSGSAHAFGKKPVVVPPATPLPPSTPTNPPVDVIRARWESSQRDGANWSKYVFENIATLAPNLLTKNPGGIAQFCPGYSGLSANDKKNFWVYLLSAMTELESSHNPALTYTEKFSDASGKPVVSRGLLQISIESGNSYGCGFKTETELHDPQKNLGCGLRILNKWVGKDAQLAGKDLVAGNWVGGSRYWSVLRAPKVTTIQGWTKAQRICAQ